MSTLSLILQLLFITKSVFGNYNGPYLFWGIDGLKNMKVSALEIMDDNILRDLYSESTAVLVFLRNSSRNLDKHNFPDLNQIVEKTEWAYIPQKWLASDPVDYNVNTEIIELAGPPSQQDVEISALYRDAMLNYGQEKVLGILATKWNTYHSQDKRHKREAAAQATPVAEGTGSVAEAPSAESNAAAVGAAAASGTVSSTPVSTTEEPMQENYIYYDAGKTILYTTSAPILKIGENSSTEDNGTYYELKSHGLVTTDERGQLIRLIVGFKVAENNKV